MDLIQYLDYMGTLAFAASGALKAVRKNMDLFGVGVLATVTAIGGGTIRDALLGERAFWLGDPAYVGLALAAALAVFVLFRVVVREEARGLLVLDAIGLGVFTAIGAAKAWHAQTGIVGVVTMACLTGVGGGMLRDVLAGDVPAVLREEIYASASLAGALAFWVLNVAGAHEAVSAGAAAALTITIRLLSIRFRWRLPRRIGGRARPPAQGDQS